MKKFIKIRTVAGASATSAEISNAYAYKRFNEFIINVDHIVRVYPIENDLTNKVYQYFRIELVTGSIMYCHVDDYEKCDELLDIDDNTNIVVNVANTKSEEINPKVELITEAEPLVDSNAKPKTVKAKTAKKTAKKA